MAEIPASFIHRFGDAQNAAEIAGQTGLGHEGRQGVIDAEGFSGQKARRKFPHVARVCQCPPSGRIIESDAEADFTGRCYCGRNVERRSNLRGKIIAPRVPAHQRHNGRAVLCHRNHRRLRCFVGNVFRQQPDQNTGRADTDDRHTFGKQMTEVHARIVERLIHIRHAPGEAVKAANRQCGLNFAGDIQSASPQNHDRCTGHFHASARLWTRIIEK